MDKQKITAIEGIKKKLLGKTIDYTEALAIMKEFSTGGLSDIFVAYFAASSFQKGFSDDELYFLTKAMVESGTKFKFPGVVADKHSIGGMPGTRTTLVVVPIIAAAGFLIPKTSSRAITTPAGTADCMEILAPVDIEKAKLQKIVETVGGCIVWGGHLGVAPADDVIIRVEEPLMFESYDKVIISILAKKVAMSSNALILDIPVGPTMKIKYVKDAQKFAKRFEKLAAKFNIEMKSEINYQFQPAGSGIGPLFETQDALRVLEQTADRPMNLEDKSLKLASRLIDLCLKQSKQKGDGLVIAEEILKSGKALKKFREIVEAQGGRGDFSSTGFKLAANHVEVKATKTGTVQIVNNFSISALAKILGAPKHRKAGLILHKKFGEKIAKNDILFELYAEQATKIEEALASMGNLPIYEIT